MSSARTAAIACIVAATGCHGCGDGAGLEFFDAESYGTYEFVEVPRLKVSRVLDYGVAPAGTRIERTLELQSVGRLPAVVDGISVTDQRFEPFAAGLLERESMPPGERAFVGIVLSSDSASSIRAFAETSSNDPDHPLQRTLLIANQDSPCVGSFELDTPVWEFHEGEGAQCWPQTFREHGTPEAYQYADIPAVEDRGWRPEPDNRISFQRRSALCGTDCACRGGGDFTYFQTQVYVPPGPRLDFVVDIDSVDDGARVTVFNDRFPDGYTPPDSYARIPGGSSPDLGPDLQQGINRIVITHIDDCCSISSIANVTVRVAGNALESCAAD